MWWLRFVDPDRPEGDQFVGAAIANGETFAEAVFWAKRNDLCPYNVEIKGTPIPSNIEFRIPDHFFLRILTREEAEIFDTYVLAP